MKHKLNYLSLCLIFMLLACAAATSVYDSQHGDQADGSAHFASDPIESDYHRPRPTQFAESPNLISSAREHVWPQKQFASDQSSFVHTANGHLPFISSHGFSKVMPANNEDQLVQQHSIGHDRAPQAPARAHAPSQLTREPIADLAPQSTTTTATTEQSNIVLYHENSPTTNSMPSAIVNLGQQSMTREYITSSGSSLNTSNTFDLGNQIVYEGPATIAPSLEDSYYFSATEKDRTSNNYNSNERTSSNAWWAIGVGHDFERATNLTRENYLDYCDKSLLLTNNKQRSLCRLHPKVMSVVARGLRLAINECQTRFASSRWNCSLVLQYSLSNEQDSSTAGSKSQIFGEVMRNPNRERSYLNAIIAAGLAQTMTKACSAGELPEECSCDKKIRSKSNKGRVEWVACSDDIDYGARFSRDFTDNLDPDEPDTTATIYLHNNEVGRRVFKSATDITCTCQGGENGLCQTKRCWKHLGSFTDVGDELMRRYESATHVQKSSKDPHKLRPVRRGVRRPKRKDLVYIAESPDYCQTDSRLGVLGTQNRLCNSTSSGPDSCSLLCCGRGYQVVLEEIEEDCNCKFVWCCQVKCSRCKRQISNDICN